IVDVSNPTSPQIIRTVAVGGTAYATAVGSGYAYVASYSALKVLNISTPGNPVVVGSLAMTSATDIAVVGNRVYLIDGAQLKIVDVSNPAAPVILSSWNNFGS